MIRTLLTITVHDGYWKGRHWVAVPEPYQAGNCPTDVFAMRHLGSLDRIVQYGQQPRGL